MRKKIHAHNFFSLEIERMRKEVMQEKVNNQDIKFTIFCHCVHVVFLGGFSYSNKIEEMLALSLIHI